MIRVFVRASIRNAAVTGSASALRLDPVILRAAELLPFEEVEIVHAETRFRTYVEAGGPGEVSVRGIPAGEAIEIVAFGLLHDGQTLNHWVRIVTIGPGNQVVGIGEEATSIR